MVKNDPSENHCDAGDELGKEGDDRTLSVGADDIRHAPGCKEKAADCDQADDSERRSSGCCTKNSFEKENKMVCQGYVHCRLVYAKRLTNSELGEALFCVFTSSFVVVKHS